MTTQWSQLQTRKSDEIVAQARLWVGTKYHHQAAVLGVGVDCVGLIKGVGLALDLFRPGFEQELKAFDGYSATPNPARMGRAMRQFLVEATDVSPREISPPPGVIAWFEWRADLPMHLAVMAQHEERPTMIHSYKPVGKCVEHGFDELWSSRVNSFWRYPGAA